MSRTATASSDPAPAIGPSNAALLPNVTVPAIERHNVPGFQLRVASQENWDLFMASNGEAGQTKKETQLIRSLK